jgi:hypothetical protein
MRNYRNKIYIKTIKYYVKKEGIRRKDTKVGRGLGDSETLEW